MSDPDSETDGETDSPGEGGPQERAREGLEHLQSAARELIQAARAALDVAEDLVNDPETVASVAATVGGLGGLGGLGDLVRQWTGSGPRPNGDDGGDGGGGGPGDGGGGEGVERITVV